MLADENCTTKVCTKCSAEKPLVEFNRHKRGRLGRHAWCKPCVNAASIACAKVRYQNDPEFRAKKIAQQATHLQSDPDARAKKLEYLAERHRRLRDTDPDYVARRAETSRAWAAEQCLAGPDYRERRRQYARAYRAANPERRALWENYRTELLKERCDGSITALSILAMKALTQDCPYCGCELGSGSTAATVDHMEPLSRGGTHSVDNILICCMACNSRKHAAPFATWYAGLDTAAQGRVEEAIAVRDGLREGGVEQHFSPPASSGRESGTTA